MSVISVVAGCEFPLLRCRAGRNGQASSAVIYVNKSYRTTAKEMKILCPAIDVQAFYSVFLL